MTLRCTAANQPPLLDAGVQAWLLLQVQSEMGQLIAFALRRYFEQKISGKSNFAAKSRVPQ